MYNNSSSNSGGYNRPPNGRYNNNNSNSTGAGNYNSYNNNNYNNNNNNNFGSNYNGRANFNNAGNSEPQQPPPDKKISFRRTVDHGNNMGRWYINRSLGLKNQQIGEIRPESSYLIDLLPSPAYASPNSVNQNKNNMAIMDIQTKFVHLSSNKAKHSINTVKWTPEGRRLLVASHSGEFTIWNGMTFNFETIMQAHDSAVFSLKYSHNDDWLLSGDQNGTIKYWQPNFNNVNIIQGHGDGIRDIAFSPNDSKFLTCSDDSTVKIWNFNNGQEERSLVGHHWDVKSADWHPNMGLIVSGSKDNLIKLWDPRAPSCVSTLHGFKHTVTKTRFQPTGTQRLLASVSRDRSCRVFDLRTMKDLVVIRDHETDLSCVAWHPHHASLLTTAAYDGSMHHYILDSHISDDSNKSSSSSNTTSSATLSSTTSDNANSAASSTNQGFEQVHKIPYAHEKAIHALEYHPLGHLLCSAGADRSARFWSRARPNDPQALQDPLYTNDKVGAWYFGVNNNINAIFKHPVGNAAGGANTNGSGNGSGAGTTTPSAKPAIHLPGLNNLPVGDNSTGGYSNGGRPPNRSNGFGSSIPGLGGY